MEEKFNRSIKRIFDECRISDEVYHKIRSVGCQPARLYGLPKIHKNSLVPPLRPILSMLQSYVTNLARMLNKILQPFIPKSRTIKDSFELIDKISSFNVNNKNENIFLTSFDVKSLFTNIPVNETVDYICEIIPQSNLPTSTKTFKELLLRVKMLCFHLTTKIFYNQMACAWAPI